MMMMMMNTEFLSIVLYIGFNNVYLLWRTVPITLLTTGSDVLYYVGYPQKRKIGHNSNSIPPIFTL